jgi:hypothetical protein
MLTKRYFGSLVFLKKKYKVLIKRKCDFNLCIVKLRDMSVQYFTLDFFFFILTLAKRQFDYFIN